MYRSHSPNSAQTFALALIGDAFLNGIPRPNDSYEVLANLSQAYIYKNAVGWRQCVGAVEHYFTLHGHHVNDEPRLPFPCWWESRPVWEFDISEWVKENLAKGVRATKAAELGIYRSQRTDACSRFIQSFSFWRQS